MSPRVIVVMGVLGVILLGSPSSAVGQNPTRGAISFDIGAIVPRSDDLDSGLVLRASAHVPAGPWMGVVSVAGLQIDSESLKLRLTPALGGVAYRWTSGRVSVTPALLAGYSFNSVAIKGFAERAELRNCFAWSPEVAVLFHTHRQFAVGLSASYFYARPTVDFASAAGSTATKRTVDGLVAAARFELAF